MASLQTFEDYRSHLVKHGGRGYPFSIRNQHTRILIGSLVRDLQRYHILQTCPCEITCRSVKVTDAPACLLLFAATQPYSKEAAKKNYKDLGVFLDDEVFGGRGAQEFYAFGHFLGLLSSDQSLTKKDLIRRHYSTLSTSYQLNFLDRLFHFGPLMNSGDADKLKAAIEKAGKPDNWDQVSSDHPFLRYVSQRLGSESNAIAKLFFNGARHEREYNKDNPGADFDLFELAKLIDLHFPNFIIKIQIELDAVGMLKRFGIDQEDRIC